MTTSSESLALLYRAADLRAHGTPWSDTAKQLAVDADHLRQLASEYRRDYDRLARRARTEAARETFDAALAALRNLLRAEDPKVSLLAATTIVRYEMTRLRSGEKAARERVERESRGPRAWQDAAFEMPELNVSELTEVAEKKEFVAATNVAQIAAPPKTTRGSSSALTGFVPPLAISSPLLRGSAQSPNPEGVGMK